MKLSRYFIQPPCRKFLLTLVTQLWACSSGVPELVHEFACDHGAVLALVAEGDTIYAGCQDGYVRVFDLETRTLVRTIIVQEARIFF